MKALSPKSPIPLRWSLRDSHAAQKEGWNIFNEDTHPEIQRDDEMAAFADDEAALAFIRASSALHCQKALVLILDDPPTWAKRSLGWVKGLLRD